MFEWFIPGIAIVLVIALVCIYQHQKRTFNPVPCFYPPENRNPAEIAYIIHNKCLSKDIISLIYYWASKGLLRIKFLKKPHFAFTFLMDMDTSFRPYEKKLFDHLWLKKRKMTTDSDLKNTFYKHINHAITNVEEEFKKPELQFDVKSVQISKLLGLGLPGILFILLVIADASRGFGIIGPILCAVFAYPAVLLIYKSVTAYRIQRYKEHRLLYIVIKLGLIACYLSFYFLLFINKQVLVSSSCLISFICLLILSCLGSCFKNYSPRRQALLEQVVGFRMFLMTAEKDRLKILLEENPDYYYDILPYAQVLGVTRQWIHRFDGLTIQQPTWMYGNDVYDMYDVMTLNTLTHTMKDSMTSAPVSSSSDSSYDGGSSGGGSGGGGGSSW